MLRSAYGESKDDRGRGKCQTLLLDSGVFYSNCVREAQPIFKTIEK